MSQVAFWKDGKKHSRQIGAISTPHCLEFHEPLTKIKTKKNFYPLTAEVRTTCKNRQKKITYISLS